MEIADVASYEGIETRISKSYLNKYLLENQVNFHDDLEKDSQRLFEAIFILSKVYIIFLPDFKRWKHLKFWNPKSNVSITVLDVPTIYDFSMWKSHTSSNTFVCERESDIICMSIKVIKNNWKSLFPTDITWMSYSILNVFAIDNSR